MEPVSLILAALVAGATTGALDALKDDAKEKAKSAYAKLRGLVGKRVAGNPAAEMALTQYEANPKVWEAPLSDELTKAGAAQDTELVAVAKQLMELLDQPGARSGKYNVTIKGSKGVYVGDYGQQTNTFN